MWPRELFDCVDEDGKAGRPKLAKSLDVIRHPGVYVLYRDDKPVYIGKAKNILGRLYSHASDVNSRLYNSWSFFSAFVVQDPVHRSQLEGILIASMPTANGARPSLPRQSMPLEVRSLMKKMRLAKAGLQIK
jgi:hypothetical protein